MEQNVPAMKSPWRWILTIGFVTLLCTVAIGAGCANSLILPPIPINVQHDGAERRMIRTSDGRQLEAFIARSPGAATTQSAAYILRFTGDAAGAAKFTANRWQHRPVEVWVVNYPGYGGSDGPRTMSALAQASLDAFDELQRIAGDRSVIVEGFSLGTTPALCVAARRPVAGVILQNPPPLKQLIIERYAWWNLGLLALPVWLQVPERLDSVVNARNVKVPAVFLVAQQDETIPTKYQQKIINTYAGEKRVIKLHGAGHYQPLTEDQERELHEAMDWLLTRAAGATTTRPVAR
jgi:pimeloyl-ACP methyl ester carboxylesterase